MEFPTFLYFFYAFPKRYLITQQSTLIILDFSSKPNQTLTINTSEAIGSLWIFLADLSVSTVPRKSTTTGWRTVFAWYNKLMRLRENLQLHRASTGSNFQRCLWRNVSEDLHPEILGKDSEDTGQYDWYSEVRRALISEPEPSWQRRENPWLISATRLCYWQEVPQQRLFL